MYKLVLSFCYALQHLSRIQIYRGTFDGVSFGRSSIFFPLVGLILGSLLWALFLGAELIFPGPVVAALLVLAMVLLTGGIHLDGFMDTMDGVFSGRPRERKLEIMRDSRVGAFGAVALVCLLLLKFSLLLGLASQWLPVAVLVAAVVSRWGMVYAIALFPYVRTQGLGRLYADHTGRKQLAVATVMAAALVFLVAGVGGLVLLGLGALVTHIIAAALAKELGGLTGDTYGAINEILEVAVLLAVYPLLIWGVM